MSDAVNIKGLTKRFGVTTALDDVSLSVRRGELFGIIGPDGAGKTTLLRILATLVAADGGRASVLGYDISRDIREIRTRVGYMPGKFSLYSDLTVKENLEFFASLFGVSVEENYYLIAPVYDKLKPFSHRRAGRLSGGMKQKLALSCALIHNPEIIFLDEPTTGVDAVSRHEFWDMLGRLRTRGVTIIVSTPYMDEASRCDRIALINRGRVMSVGSADELIKMFPCHMYAASADNMYQLLVQLRNLPGVKTCYPFGSVHHITTTSETDIIKIKNQLNDKEIPGLAIYKAEPTIEDLFITLMQ